MPQTVPIEIFNVARTQVDREEVKRWLAFLGAPDFDIPEEEAVSNPALLIALAGKRCYKSFVPGLNPNVNKIRSDYGEYFDNILKSGHGSVLEHSVFTYAIENVSRVFTGEMNRHRAGWAISEGSMRFIRYGENLPYWEPESISGPDVHMESLIERIEKIDIHLLAELAGEPWHALPNSLEAKKHFARLLFKRAFTGQQHIYKALEVLWADELKPESKFTGKKEITSMMRRIIGMGVATGGVWTGNVRALRHVLTMRCSAAAEEEILHVFSRIAKLIRDQEPLLFGDFHQNEAGYWCPKYVKV